MKKVLICNCPPQTGKDEFVKYLSYKYGIAHLEFKDKLIKLTKMIYDVSDESWNSIYVSGEKDKPRQEFDGRSARQALIYVSEDVIKPKFGESYFGKCAVNNLRIGVNGFSDGGFYEEMIEVVNHVGKENALIIRIDKEGRCFKDDSRGYVDIEGVEVIKVDNNGSLGQLHKQADNIYNYLLHK